jgi:redox-sensitive bicupin YhaK (pirin superfamily)
MSRRKFIKQAALATAGTVFISKTGLANNILNSMSNTTIKAIHKLGAQWPTQDPFMFCAHHLDNYPGGNDKLGPNVSLTGRNIGQDFAGIDGWNMYHGDVVPGFPAHPHCGFETITIVTQGMADHSDSLGGKGRFGEGDVQWLTSGKGVQHAEMFPLLKEDANPFELFQIWLNLPRKSKKVEAHYKMLWAEDIPVIEVNDTAGKKTIIDLVAGHYDGKEALSPTPDSWAADEANEVQIWKIKMEAGATFSIPKSKGDVNRSLFFYNGSSADIAGEHTKSGKGLDVVSTVDLEIVNGAETGYFVLLQGKSIGEPVVHHGPFVANSNEEINAAMMEFR